MILRRRLPTGAAILFWSLATIGTLGLALVVVAGFTHSGWLASTGMALFIPCFLTANALLVVVALKR